MGVASGKFLGFVQTSKEIQLDPEKVCAIQEMQVDEEGVSFL